MLSIVVLGGSAIGSYVLCLPCLIDQSPEWWKVTSASLVRPASPSAPPVSDDNSAEDAAEPAEGTVEIVDLTGPGETLLSLLNSNLADEASAEKVATSLAKAINTGLNKPFDRNTPLKAGCRYSLTLDRDDRFLKASLEYDPANVFYAVAHGNEIKARKEDVVLEFKPETLSFKVENSLIESLLNQGEGQELALKLTNVFRWDIDFQSESQSGDVCKIRFERRYADDRPSGYGRILLAVYDGKKTGKKTAVLFNERYCNQEGVELKKSFLRSPLRGVLRVTSKFGRRYHPIYKKVLHHDGVDYGAPVGTSVWSVANGVVTFAGWKKGYGKFVCITHDNGYESQYGHLSRYFTTKGQKVKQGVKIGLTGDSGEVTGPHLHFNLLVGGKLVDPERVKMVKTVNRIPSPLQARFDAVVKQRLQLLEENAASVRISTSKLATVH